MRAAKAQRRTFSRPSLALSALLHVLLVAALVLGLRQSPPEAIVPPSTFAVVFAHGGAPRTTAPRAKPSPLPLPPSVAQSPSVPHPAATPAPTAAPPARSVGKPSPARAPAPRAAPPVPTAPPQRFAVRLPAPANEAPTLHETLVPLPRPVERAPPAPPRPAPQAPQSPRYLVMNRLSFGASGEARATPRRGLNLALNRPVLNGAVANDFAIEGKIGPDWKAELTAWVNAHKYYPRSAIDMRQQGKVEIAFVVARNGQVRSVSLLRSSGSPFLDQAWLGLFRGATLPPFPAGTEAGALTIRATMHYILIEG